MLKNLVSSFQSQIHRNLTSTDIEAFFWVSFATVCYGVFIGVCYVGGVYTHG